MSLMNRLHNARNPHQGSDRKVLCLCSAGLLRSPTTANVLYETFGYNTRAAGVNEDYALVPVDEVLISWADEIVCVEKSVHTRLVERFESALDKYQPDVIVLSIPDKYPYNDVTLQSLILKQYDDSEIMKQAFT